MKTKINSDDDLTLEKTLNMHNVAILVKSGFNKNHNHYHRTLTKKILINKKIKCFIMQKLMLLDWRYSC